MAAGHGGGRAGAGRPKGTAPRGKTPPAAPAGAVKHYDDALAYLEAVVRGDEAADPLRIAAARIVLPYQNPKTRAPVESPSPSALRAKAKHAKADDWERRAAAVKARFKKGAENA